MTSTTPRFRRTPRVTGIVAIALLMLLQSCVNSKTLGDLFPAGDALDEQTVASGLREALEIGTQRTVDSTSKLDGFFGNALIRVAMPEQLQGMANTLRDVGLNRQVDEFELAMNRAAERAAGEATSVFWDAIRQMTIADAFGILKGGETAATDYFRERTTETLRSRFRPIVQNKMSEVGLYNVYNTLVSRYNTLPFVTTPALDLDAYVTDRALFGLFTVLGQEEARIRRDPVARTTALLRRVFGT